MKTAAKAKEQLQEFLRENTREAGRLVDQTQEFMRENTRSVGCLMAIAEGAIENILASENENSTRSQALDQRESTLNAREGAVKAREDNIANVVQQLRDQLGKRACEIKRLQERETFLENKMAEKSKEKGVIAQQLADCKAKLEAAEARITQLQAAK